MEKQLLVNKQEINSIRAKLLGQNLRKFFSNIGFNLSTFFILIIAFVLILILLMVGLLLVRPGQKSSNPSSARASVKQSNNAFNSKISTSVLAGNITGIDLNKGIITITGQVDTSIQIVTVNYSKNTNFEKVSYDPKTQAKVGSNPIDPKDIKVNDVVQLFSSKKIGSTSVAAGDIVKIEILKPE